MPFDAYPWVWPVFNVLLSIWLVALARVDLRTREVPALVTAVPLLMAGLARVALWPPDGALWPGGVAVALALLMILLSDNAWLAAFPAALAVGCAGLAGPETRLIVGSWFAALLLALLGIWGAGDGKVFATLLALFPDARLLVTLVVAVELGSVLALVHRHGRATPWALYNVGCAALRLDFPCRTGQRGEHPTVPWLALGTLAYLALRLGGGG